MNYFTTKQISEKWSISPNRIYQLCQQGRVEGAILRDRRWLIPENAPKPADTRTKASKAAGKEDKFVFPYIIATVHSPEQVEGFSEDEKSLYRADCLYEAGEFEKCAEELKKLLADTDNRYIRLGALYLLPFVYLYLSDMELMSEYSVMFKTDYYEFSSPTAELSFLFDSFNTEMSGYKCISEMLDPDIISGFSDDALPFLSLTNAVAEIVRSSTGEGSLNIFSHEMLCAKIERDGYYYCAAILHGYISMMYSVVCDEEKAHRHLKRAVDIAVEHNTYFSLVQIMTFYTDCGLEILKDYPENVVEKFRHCASYYVKARAALSEYCCGSTVMSQLNKNDYVLMSYCLKDYSVEKMAELLSLSESGVKKRLSSLYKKLGASNRKDMQNKYLALVLNTGNEEKTS